jgi:uncharacterized repeat protein (TIGR01451 family)
MRRIKLLIYVFLYFLLLAASPVFAHNDDLILSHTGSPEPAASAGLVDYTITVTNGGDDALIDNIQVTDMLPSGITFISATPSQGSCSAPSGSDPSRQLTCNLNSLAVGVSATVTVQVRTAAAGTITNSASVTSTTSGFIDPHPTNNSLAVVTTVNWENDLVLNHTDSPDPGIAGGLVDYTITVTNGGNNLAINDIRVTDILPSDITFISATPSQGSCTAPSGGQFTCDLGSLSVLASATVVVRVRTSGAGTITTITNRASVASSSSTDPDLANNSQDEVTTVNQGADLSLAKSSTPTPSVQAGATLAYYLTVNNLGPDTASSVRVVDTLPPGFNVTGALPSGCSQAGQTITCDISGTIASGSNTVVGPINGQISVSGGSLTNVASVSITSSTAPQDPVTANNTATLVTTVSTGSDVFITKSQSVSNPNQVTTGTTFYYTLTPRYTGDVPINITVTDTVPAGITVASVSGTGWDCTASSGQAVSCFRVSGGASAGYSVAMPAITVNVSADAVGSYTNTAYVSSESDITSGNNSATIYTTVVQAAADLRANKSALRTDNSALSPALVVVGNTFKWRLSITNGGPSAFTGTLRLTDNLPANVRIDSYTNQSSGYWSCDHATPVTGADTVICSTGSVTLNNGATTPYLELNVTATGAGTLSNTANSTASSGTPQDITPGNNSVGSTVISQLSANAANLQMVKTVSGTVTAGDLLTYTLQIVNLTVGVTATNVTLTDTLTNLIDNQSGTGHGLESSGITTAGTSAGGSCSSAASGSTGRALTCSFTSIAPCTLNSNCPVVTVQVRPNGTTPRSNSATAFSANVADPDISNNTSEVSSTVSQRTDVTVSISDTPDPVRVGANLTYVATAINQGVSAAVNSTVTVTLPLDVTFISASPTAGSGCTTPGAGSLTAAGNRTVTCNLGTLHLPSPGYTDTEGVTIVVRPTIAVGVGATITASAEVVTDTAETNSSNNSASTTTIVTAPSHDLLVNKIDSPDPVTVGENVTYTITATNNGPSYASDVQILDTLPSTSKLSFVSATGPSGSCGTPSGGTITCALGDLTSGSHAHATVVMTGVAKGIGNNTVTVSSAETRINASYDSISGNNTVTEDTTVRTKADPEVVSKTARNSADDADISSIGLRRPFLWKIAIRNNAVHEAEPLSEADNVTVTDSLPANMVLTGTPAFTATSGTFSTSTCTGVAGSTSFTCSLGTVSSGATGTITVPVRANAVTGSTGSDIFFNTATIATSSLDVDSGNNSKTGQITVVSSSLAGRVWKDTDESGTLNEAEPAGINGVVITLSGGAWDGATINRTTTTSILGGVTGSYKFSGLPEGAYTITETQPLIYYFDGADIVGSACGTVNCGTVSANDTISEIQLAAAANGINYNFGEIPAASISGYVWHDQDNDGNRDGGETTGIQNVAITLSGIDVNGSVSAATTTNASGAYSFGPLRAGTYTVTETQPSSPWLPGMAAIGTIVNVDGTPQTATGIAFNTWGVGYGNSITGIALATGYTASNYNFGEIRTASISGYVFIDTDGDAVRHSGAAGVTEVNVSLGGYHYGANGIDNSGGVDDIAVTDTYITGSGGSNGSYSFTGLRPGIYTVTQTTTPAGLTHTGAQAGSKGGTIDGSTRSSGTGVSEPNHPTVISAITIVSNDTANGYNFGESGQGLSGYVYFDLDDDGYIDDGESGISGVTLTLSGTTSGSSNVCNVISPSPCIVTTNASGFYNFAGLPTSGGSGYTITETQPTSYGDGRERAGTLGGTVDNSGFDDTAARNRISEIPILNTNDLGTGYNFGERGGSLSGYVYNDIDNDGSKETGEPGILSVLITLTGTDINGNSINRTTTTAANGYYIFSNLPRPNSSGYTITETQPTGYNYKDGKDTEGTACGTGSCGTVSANDTISGIQLAAGANGINYNFGELTYAQISGLVWLDGNHNRAYDDVSGSDREGWTVQLIKRDDPLDNTGYLEIARTTTDANGTYTFTNILPNNPAVTTDRYEIRFLHPQNLAVFGVPVSALADVVLTYGTIRNILLNAGDVIFDQNLPLDPGGMIYNSVTRQPVEGAAITITGPAGFDYAEDLDGGTANATQVTTADGLYQFLLLPTAPSGQYTLTVTPPGGYMPGPSALIPRCTTALTVGSMPDPPLLIQTSNTAPASGTPLHAPASCPSDSAGVAAGASSTQYYLLFNLYPGTSAAVVNNHIPIDPVLGGAIIVTKTTPLVNVTRGDLVPYTITMTNTLSATLTNIDARDIVPPGFKYRKGSGTLNGVRTEPLVAGRQLTWRNLTFTAGEKKTFLLILVVGSGVSEGEYTNQAYAANNIINAAVSNIATATVRVVPDPTFDCPDIIGKVFDDKNANGYQDEGELGLANVRLATARGLIITTDAEGRFHIPCPSIPNENRGSNFILKLDERTLPSGYRITTENPRVVRLTRGKMTKINFGATVHRVIRIDVNNAAFEKEGTKLLSEWQQKIAGLETQLREKPSVVRIAYRKGTEPKSLVNKRIKAIRDTLQVLWKKGKDCPPLVFEEEIVEVK